MPFPYKKVLFIGATSGIGRALTLKLLANNISVIAVGRRTSNLSDLVNEHAATTSTAALATATFDITALSSIPSFAKDVTSSHPDIDAVFLNSGHMRTANWADLTTISLDTLDAELLLNYTAQLHLTAAFLPHLQALAPAPVALLYTTSGLALVPHFGSPGYAAGKAALHHHILALREQLRDAGSNVRVVELLPPMVQTELKDATMGEAGRKQGMDLGEFVEEAWEGLSREGTDGEELPVQLVRTWMGAETWEKERQGVMLKMNAAIAGKGT